MNNQQLTTKAVQTDTGFTIIEAFVAVTILLVAVAGPLTIVTKGLSSAIYAKEQITATFLAQGAVEMTRNRRDENFLNSASWLDTISGSCAAPDGCIVDITQSGASTFQSCSGTCPVLRRNTVTGQYGYGTGSNWNDTEFTRTLIIEEVVADVEAKVTVTTSWQKGALSKTIEVTDQIFNWQ